jgi:hypothetical protein
MNKEGIAMGDPIIDRLSIIVTEMGIHGTKFQQNKFT